VNTMSVTQRIKTGQRIRVDDTNGAVSIFTLVAGNSLGEFHGV
jgi:hypothetical protein